MPKKRCRAQHFSLPQHFSLQYFKNARLDLCLASRRHREELATDEALHNCRSLAEGDLLVLALVATQLQELCHDGEKQRGFYKDYACERHIKPGGCEESMHRLRIALLTLVLLFGLFLITPTITGFVVTNCTGSCGWTPPLIGLGLIALAPFLIVGELAWRQQKERARREALRRRITKVL